MSYITYFKKALLLTSLVLFVGCGSAQNPEIPTQNSNSNSDSAKNTENPVTPGNLPPPGQATSQSQSLSLNEGSAFFQRKEVWDSFSPKLKQKVYESYSKKSSIKNGTTYDTLFGKITIEDKTEVVIVEDKISAQEVKSGGELITQNFAITATLGATGPCSNGANFLCVSTPRDRDGVVVDVLHVDGAIIMDQAAFFGPLDPVAMVSVFKQSGTSPLQRVGEFPILPSDLVPVSYQAPRAAGADADPAPVEIGPFQKVVPLSGSGVYQIIVSAWKNTEAEAQLETKRFVIYRQSVPQFATNGVKVYPANRGATPQCDKQNPITITSVPVNVSLRDICVEAELQEEGTPNVGVIVENYSRNGSALVLNYSGSGTIETSTHSTNRHPIITTIVPVNGGLNHFKVKVRNSLLSTPLPDGALKEFELINQQAQYSLKFSNASVVDGKIIEPRSETDTVSVQFCISADGTTCAATWPETAKPKIFLNSTEVPAASILRDSTGQYSTSVHPMVGMNTFSVQVPTANGNSIPDYKAAFGFGKVNKLYDRGQLKEQDNFLTRGLSLNIGNQIIQNDLKRILFNYLNSDTFKSSFRGFFQSSDTSPRSACTETFYNDNPSHPELSVDSGETSIEFLEEGFRVGNFELSRFESTNNGRIELEMVLKGLHGEANLRGLRMPVQVNIGGRDASFIPLSISVAELRVKLGIKFNKDQNGVQSFQIERLSSDAPAVEIIGDDAFGKYLHVNSTRNPLVASLEQFEQQSGTFSMQFRKGVEASLLCGTENKLNSQTIGLGQWLVDLPKLASYNNQDPFRAVLQFSMLGKQVGIDIAYDVLHAKKIAFNSHGIQIENIPLRFSPGPVVLALVPDAIKNSLIGSISHPDRTFAIPSEAALDTSDVRNLSLKMSEDALNQALFAASFAGMLDIDIDPNFFTNNQIPFISPATPTVKDMIGVPARTFFDLNQNGVDDDEDLPIKLRLVTNKSLAPFIHFLTPEEINTFAQNVERVRNEGATPENQVRFNRGLKYFKFTLPDLELGIYRVMTLPDSVKAFCSASQAQKQYPDPERPEDLHPTVLPSVLIQTSNPNGMTRACRQSLSIDYDIPLDGQCAEHFEKVTVPSRNGEVVSAVPGVSDVAVVKFKGTLTAYGVFQGVSREATINEMFTVNTSNGPPTFTANPNPSSKNLLRIKFLTTDMKGVVFDLKVAESHIPIFGQGLLDSSKLSQIISAAIGGDCERFNEIRIPIPDKFVDDPAVHGDFMENLASLGITSLNLGDQTSNLPTIAPDASGLYLDLTAHLGIGYPMVPSP